ncbi:unnamed protein product [Protopolystoma xenopodis]|uniref:Amine oxidase domain-containing protein n=1 Tax=Protopolystoma xenopodis TaxID=117903 RepID=A0A3S5AEQ3_9PLAT|nr:unnamed protein product [Protopolystoma xenopodis]
MIAYRGDALICTLPLGVLKASVATPVSASGSAAFNKDSTNSTNATFVTTGSINSTIRDDANINLMRSTNESTSSMQCENDEAWILNKDNAPRFCPPLPEWKRNAIDRLGFGILNKVCQYTILDNTSFLVERSFAYTIFNDHIYL